LWEIRETMKESEIEIILQRAVEKFPGVSPRIISDNGPQFMAKDFKEFIRFCGMTHGTSRYYPQSNGKIERWHKSIKVECIRPGVPLTIEDARRIIETWITQDLLDAMKFHIPKPTPATRVTIPAELSLSTLAPTRFAM
jgi:putative transposase